MIGAVLLLIVSGSLVSGQSREGWLTSAKTRINKNDFIDEFNVKLMQTDNSTFVSMSINVTQTLPKELNVWWKFTFHGGWYWWRIRYLCEQMMHSEIGPYLRSIILPKNRFPKTCPMIPGNWSVVEWEPPWHLFEWDNHPDGPFFGILKILPTNDRNKPYLAEIQFEGVLSKTLR